MKIRIVLMGIAVLCAAACASTPGSVEARIRELEQQQLRVALKGDRAALEQVFAPQFRLVNPSGAVASRDELLTMLSAGTPPYRAASYVTESVMPYGDVVVTLGTEDVEFGAGAQAGQRQRRRITQVWERHGNDWRLVQRQATLIAP